MRPLVERPSYVAAPHHSWCACAVQFNGGDLLAVIEAAYASAPSDEAWLVGLTRAAVAPVLDQGLVGFFAHTYELRADTRVSYGALATAAGPVPETFGVVAAGMARRLPESAFALLYPRAPAAGYATELANVAEGTLTFTDLHPHARDTFGIVGANPSGQGVVLHSLHAAASRLGPAEKRLWTRVATHLAAGYRLRCVPSESEAVIAPSGRVEHAEGDARQAPHLAALGDAARAIDRARGKLRRADPPEALALWQSLVAGQWSLVDHVDTDGRRYMFARKNAPKVRPWANLTDRERQVLAYAAEGHSHKMIAYDLGIGVSTVGTHLKRAAAKLGLRSRIELVAAFKQMLVAT